jgi:hypothetical protein
MRIIDLSRKLRSPRLRVASTVFAVAAFFGSMSMSCWCAPECGDNGAGALNAGSIAADHGCCSPQAPEEALPADDCCSGIECHRDDVAHYKLVQTNLGRVIDFTEIVLELPLLEAPPAITPLNHHALSNAAKGQGPPAYLRFGILLI